MSTSNSNHIDIEQDAQCSSGSAAAEQPSQVARMFCGKSVFVTGASGFIGRVLLERLLSSYPSIKTIYILMRPKRNQDPHERLHKQLLRAPIFDKIKARANGAELLAKIQVIAGDLAQPWLGMACQDLELLVNDPSLAVVFHSAATIKFDEPLRVSVLMNLVATKTVLDLCKRLPNLVSFCHVSTAYVNSDILDESLIEEKLYPIAQEPQNLIQLAQLLDEAQMQTLKSHYVSARPNTYTYTKALAEHLIARQAGALPVAIVRPSIVVGAMREPLPGWVDNVNGPTGLILAIGKGLLRSLYINKQCVADLIPVDVTVNTMIASAYYVARKHNKLAEPAEVELAMMKSDHESKKDKTRASETLETHQDIETPVGDTSVLRNGSQCEPEIVHCNSGHLNPIVWGQLESSVFPIIRRYPSAQVFRYPFGTFKSNRYHDLVARLFAHFLPAMMLDFLCVLLGKKRQLLFIYDKLHSAIGALSHFTSQVYRFETKNLLKIHESLNEHDRKHLFMDVRELNWTQFWNDYVLGARRYVLREDDSNLAEARSSFLRAYYLEIAFRCVLLMVFVGLCWPLITNYVLPMSSIVWAA